MLWGFVSDRRRRGARKVYLLTINVLGLIGALLLFIVPPTAPIVLIGCIVALAGLALIGYQGLLITMIAEVAGPERVGAARALRSRSSRARSQPARRCMASSPIWPEATRDLRGSGNRPRGGAPTGHARQGARRRASVSWYTGP